MKGYIFNLIAVLSILGNAVFLFIPQGVEAENYIKQGNSVLSSTSMGDVIVTPHTLASSGWVKVEFQSKSISGDVDISFGFDGKYEIKTVKAESWENYEHTLTREVDAVVTGTFKPEKVIQVKQNVKTLPELGVLGLNAQVSEVIYDETNTSTKKAERKTKVVAYDTFDGATFSYKYNGKKLEEYKSTFVDWNPYKTEKKTETVKYSGSTKWEAIKHTQPIIQNTWYTARFWVEVPFKGTEKVDGKYNVVIKPSNLTVAQAINQNKYILLDPWYSISWLYQKSMTITGTTAGLQNNYQKQIRVRFNTGVDGTYTTGNITMGLLYCNSKCQVDFDDLRFTRSDGQTLLDYWIEQYTSANSSTVWVEFNYIPASPSTAIFYVYYGNSSATSASSGANTFIKFEDFEWGANATALSTSGGSVTWASSAAGTSKAEISTAQYYSGSRSGRWYRDGVNNSIAYISSVTASYNQAIRWMLRKDDTSQPYVQHGNGTNAYIFYTATSEDIYYYATIGSVVDTTRNATINAWEMYEISDFRWGVSGDFLFKTTYALNNASINALTASYANQIYILNAVGTSEVFIDNILVRNWCSPEPTFTSWGTEESDIGPTPTISSANVFTGYRETNDWLITFLYLNIYEPYYSEGYDSAQLFNIQFVNNNTVVAQTPCFQFGYKPGCIYLSANATQSLQYGFAYKIRVRGNFGTLPYGEYILTSADWKGANLGLLDSWVRSTVVLLETYYSSDFTDYVAGRGLTLNSEGQYIYVTGIPGLNIVRPDLFTTTSAPLTVTESTFTHAYQSELAWQTMLGTTLTTLFTDTGSQVGLTGAMIGMIIAFMFWALMAGLAFRPGAAIAAIIIPLPFLLAAFYVGLIALVVMGVICSICGMLLVKQLWWDRA